MSWRRSFTFLASLAVIAGLAAPPEARAAEAIKHPAQVFYPVKQDVSPPLSSITPLTGVPEGKKAPENPPLNKQGRLVGKPEVRPDAVLQTAPGTLAMPSPIVNFEGVNNVWSVYPPDTQGDVGPNHFIQWVNLGFAIYDKAGTKIFPASGFANGNTLWSGFGGACETSNDGDPMTNYDHLADRWVMSQFALPNFPSGPFYQCFAISQTGDPLGSWYRYAYATASGKMNDYPKIGVWPDAYYMTVNQFNAGSLSWGGLGVAAFDRASMLAGLPAAMVYWDTGAVTLNYGGALPADLDGPAPPAGTPGYVMEWDDSSWIGDPTDTLRIWEAKPNWANPPASTFGADANYTPNFFIPTADATANLCGGARNCIPQPGTSQGVDSISDRLMQRLQYRYLNGSGRLTTNMTVDGGGGRAGVRWYQIADPGSGWSMLDQGTFAPADTEHRWMGAAALDIQGNMAVGYSVSSGTVYPSIRYNGRLAGDPAGTLGTEASIIVGSGSQTGSAARWGDYSAMLVDPTDECTFWYTQEYYQVTSAVGWQTRVASFKFPGCVAGPSGTIDGTVKSAGGNPIAGATVQVGGSYSTTTNGSGFFTITVPVGTYDVTASKFGYSPVTVSGVVVSDGVTTHLGDILLTPNASAGVDGFVTAAIHNWPLWAKVEIRQAGTLISTLYTSPWDGYYSATLPIGYTYDFTVQSMYDGYQAEVRPVAVAGDLVQNFSLLAGSGNPAYNCYLDGGIAEQFEGAFPPLGWTVKNNGAGPGNVWKRNDQWGRANNTGGTGYSAAADSDIAGSSSPAFNTELWSPPIKMPATPRNLKFKHNFNWIGTGDYAYVDVSTNGGTSWTNLRTFTADNTAEQTINMTAYADQMIVLRWKYVSVPWAWWWQVDNVRTETIVSETTISSQNFDGVTAPALPADWSVASFGGGATWITRTTSVHPTGVTPHSSPNMPVFNSYSVSSGSALLYKNTSDNLSGGNGNVSFWMYHDTGFSGYTDSVQVAYSTDGTNFNLVGPQFLRYGGPGWALHTVPLTGVSSSTVWISLYGVSDYGNDIHIDDVRLFAAPPPVTDTPSLLCDAVPGSLIAGFVTDANTTGGIPGALIVRDLGGSTSAMAATANLPDGFYYMFSGSALPAKPNGPSTRTFTASKAGYGTVEKSLNPIPSALNRVDFALPAASLSLAGWPFDLRGRLTPDGLPVSEKTRTFSILNSGGLAANVKLSATQLGSGWIPPLPMQPAGPLTMAPQWVAKQPLSLKDVPLLPRPAKPAPPRLDAGDVLASWATGLALPWGAGTTGATVWASNPSAGGGDDYDYEYTADGTQTGRKVQAVFGGVWAADMTRADANGMLWQLNVGGDNCIYEVDPDAGMTGNKICPAWGTSQRGLAYDPESDTFFGGGWNDFTIYRFDRAGVIGQQVNTGLSISGLAYNPATQHLFVMENAAPNNVTVLDVANGYAVLGSFSIAGFGDYSGAGLEFGCDGLWAINQADGNAYLVDAGESYPCGANLPWFTLSPSEGMVPPANGEPGQLNILGEFFPGGVNPAHFGLFRAQVKSTNDSPFSLPTIPVYMTKAFWDVPTGYWADVYIHGLAGARVTRGCGLGNYCPEVNLTRAQMAIFLVRGAHGPDFVPPPAIGIFADVPIYDGDTTADFIEQLYNDGYTVGCSVDPLLYCPADLMPREQMAVFLVRLKNGPTFVPPPATGIFGDVPSSDVFAPWIEQAYADGITVGCSADPLLYCPKDKVTRAQIAVFLVRVLGIPYLP